MEKESTDVEKQTLNILLDLIHPHKHVLYVLPLKRTVSNSKWIYRIIIDQVKELYGLV